VSFENTLCVIKDVNNLEVSKIHLKNKSFALDLMREVIHERDIKKKIKIKRRWIFLEKVWCQSEENI